MSHSRKSLGNLASSLFLYPISILTGILIAVKLGPELKGVFTYVLMLRTVFIPIAFMGLGTGIHYFLAAGKFRVRDVALPILLLAAGLGLLIAVGVHYAFHWSLLGNINDDLPDGYLHFLLWLIPLHAACEMAKSLFYGNGDYRAWNLAQVASIAAYAGVALVGLQFLNLGLRGAMFAMVAETVVLSLVTGYFLLRHRYLAPRLRYDFLPETLRYGMKTIGGTLSSKVNDRFDYFMLGYFVNSEVLGIYSVGYSLVKLVTIVPTAIAPVLINRVAGERDRKSQVDALARVHAPLFLLSILVGAGILAGGYWGIPLLYGEAYSGAFPVLLILAIGILPFAVTRRMIDNFFNGADRPLYPTLVQGAGAVMAIAANVYLVPRYGISGAAWATTVSWLTSTVVSIWLLHHFQHGSWRDLFRFSGDTVDWAVRRVKEAVGLEPQTLK